MALSIGYGAVVTGLVLYTSSHVAEIVRGSVQAVDRGQTEAAEALGLSSGQRLRFVVLPQAFRIAVPPMINQFLNLTKNSSLAIAVGYAELAAITLVLISQANPAPQMVLLLMSDLPRDLDRDLDHRQRREPPPAAGRAVTATLQPPATVVSRTRWVRENLARTPLDAALTIVFGLFLAWAAYRGLRFLLVTADWEIVRRNLRLFMVGRFPTDQLWRPWAAAYVLAATLGLCTGRDRGGGGHGSSPGRHARAASTARPPRCAPVCAASGPWCCSCVAMLVLIRTPLPGVLLIGLVGVVVATRAVGRRLPGLARWIGVIVAAAVLLALQIVVAAGGVGWDDWGGLQLTLFVTVAGIVLAFPMGVLAALGRRSSLPAIRVVSVGYIELFRAVPLVAFLFIGQYLMLYAVPTFVDPPSFLIRALVVIALFESAYIAEIVRGGLQSIPIGQLEAAQALGLGPLQTTRRVVLPQALRNVIPAIVGQFISLFKDTSLLAIVGFFEVLDVARSVPSQPDFVGQGLSSITLAFAGFVYWVGSYTMSRESRRLETRMGVGTR